MESADAVVVGAGVVGLAVARSLARAGREVLVLEAGRGIGGGVSSRNSEVVHAGLYYPTGSLKARLCVAGRERLYAYCEERGVAHRRCGKLVVATDEAQLAGLDALERQALANGVVDVRRLAGAEAMAMEPGLQCVAALHSPSTGIVDSHGLMLALQGEAEGHGAWLAFDSPLLGARVVDGGFELQVGGGSPMALHARTLVNAAALAAPRLASRIQGLPAAALPTSRLAKGSYFALPGKAPFGRLVYPMHQGSWLGVHLTLDLGGQARFGPDSEWLPAGTEPEDVDYRVDPARAEGFYDAIRRYWPALPDGALQPAYAGVRPKIHGPGEPVPDFRIDGPAAHGVPGLVSLFGIESPGLTASLAIGDHVAGLLQAP